MGISRLGAFPDGQGKGILNERWKMKKPKKKKEHLKELEEKKYCDNCEAQVSDDGYSIDEKACFYCKLDW